MVLSTAVKEIPNSLLTWARKATTADVEAIISIAASVGQAVKDPTQGFLVDDYQGEKRKVRKKLCKAVRMLPYFYVAQRGHEIVGFLMAYPKEEWLKETPNWIEDIQWHPCFDQSILERFVLVDKTAIRADLTGQGIGSVLYEALKEDIRKSDIKYLIAETVINPVPNFASLHFRIKQRYQLAGTRYEYYNEVFLTDLVYYKKIE